MPASSANLGPGFDCFAAALGLHLELEVTETGRFAVETDLDVPLGRENLCVRAFESLHRADDFTFRIRSEIPLTGGLGSSAVGDRRRACSPPTICSSSTSTCSRARPRSRATPTTSPPRSTAAS